MRLMQRTTGPNPTHISIISPFKNARCMRPVLVQWAYTMRLSCQAERLLYIRE
jgi:hypothetical protein